MTRSLIPIFLFGCVAASQGALSVPTSLTTGVQNFSATPAATEWSTVSMTGAATTLTSVSAVETAAQALTAAGVATALGTQAANAANVIAQRSSNSNFIYTAATGNNATALMATLQNDSGSALSTITVAYDHTRIGGGVEESMGHRVFYSLTGLANSWTLIPALSGIGTNQALSTNVVLSSSWANTTKLYLLWVDDNGSGTDGPFTIDNFVVTASANTPPVVTLTAPLNGAFTGAPGTFALTATATDNGSVTQVEFLRNGSVIHTDTTAPYSFSDTGLVAGNYSYAARATDNLGVTATSTAAGVNVFTDPAKTALQFDGVNDFVTMGAATSTLGTATFTIECWFKRTGTGVGTGTGTNGITSAIPLVTKGKSENDGSNVDCNYFLGIDTATNRLCADFEATLSTPLNGTGAANNNYPVFGTTVITNNVWTHAAATWDGSGWKLFINGVEETVTVSNLLPTPAPIPRGDSIQHFGIGTAMNSAGAAVGFFQGVIDEARVWSTARTPAEIATGKDLEVASATGLIGRYGMNEATGLTVSNSPGVAGAPLGTLTSGPLWVDGYPFVPVVPPTVTLTAPTAAFSGMAPATVSFAADASDADGSITKVEFFQGTTKVGEDTTGPSPYTFEWTGVAVGTYSLTAKATDNVGATTTSAAVNITVSPNSNQAPVITATSPAADATGIGVSTTLNVSLSDPESDAMTVTFYGRKTTPAAPGADFTLATLPDTQFYAENLSNNGRAATFHAQTQWLVDNRDALNLAFVSHMGDIVQNGDAVPAEWTVADESMKRIENQVATLRAYGIPWGAAPGNHDQTSIGNAGGANVFFNNLFGASRFAGRSYWGGNESLTNNNNNYQLFSASGLDFIILHLEYDARAVSSYQAILDWADAVMKAFPNRRAIVTSHWIVNTGNPASFSTQGQAIYDNLKDNPNFFLMLCGHVAGEGQRSDTFQGRTVHSVLQDYQGRTNGGDGWLRYFTFSPANNTINAKTYRVSNPVNPAAGAFETDADSQFSLAYNMQSAVTDWIPLGTANVASGGTSASLNWTGLEAGSHYEWYASVTDTINTASTTARRFSTTSNAAPSVAITAPANNASFTAPAAFTVTADAADTDGSISRVEFYQGTTKLGEDTAAPFEQSVTGLLVGNHAFSAIAVDNSGATTLSSIVNVSVLASVPPTVSITAPAAAASFDALASITITADAADGDGSVSLVEFFNGATKLGEDATAPYSYDWTGVISGSYSLTAKATDNAATTTTSAAVAISVTNVDNAAPTVAITSPSDNAAVAPAVPLTLNATASDTDGVIAKVEFFDGATLLGEDTTAPYSFTIASLASGAHTFTAKATDNDAGNSTSSIVNVTGDPALWAYAQNFDSMASGTATPSGWSFYGVFGGANTTFTDSIAITTASIVGGTLNNTLIASTTIPATTASSNTQGYNFALAASPTDRALGTSPTSGQFIALQVSLTNPTGTALNAIRLGYDIRRFTSVATANELPGYFVFYSLDNGTTWNAASGLNPSIATVPNTVGVSTMGPDTISFPTPWADGATLLIRWIDDNAVATSPDQIIGLDNVTITRPVGNPPTVAITAPAVSYVGDTINLSATAADSDGSITKVEFYNGATKLGEDTTEPYEYAWSGVTAATYSLTARATDTDNNTTTSSVATVVVNAAAGSGTLTRSPYLNMPTDTSIVVRWRTSQAVVGRVRYGISSAALTLSMDESVARTDHEVRLTGLTPYTRYYYSVGSALDTLTPETTDVTSVRSGTYTFATPTADDYTFRTTPTPGTATNTRIWVVGDCGRGSATQAAGRDAYYNWMGSRVPDLNLQLGDNAYNSGTDSEYQSGYFAMYPTIFRKMPQWSCLGNHDANNTTPGGGGPFSYPYFDMFTFPTAGEAGGVASGTEHYYSFDYGNIHFVCLDSNSSTRTVDNPATTGVNEDGPMAAWLRQDLASTTRTWIIAFFHHPPYSKGSHDSDTEAAMVQMRTNFNPILETGGVDLVLTGHSHNYERSVLLDGNYGTTGTITAAMKKNADNGSTTGFTTNAGGVIRNAANGFTATATVAGTVIPPNGAYMKPLTGPRDHFGAVYNTAGMSGQADGGSINHSAMYISYSQVGTVNLDINGNTLVATFIQSDGSAPDNYTIIKSGAADSDGDGLTDEFELANGLNRSSAADSTTDADGDGISNLVEFAFGTNPGTSDPGKLEVTGGVITKRGQPDVSITNTTNGVDFKAAFCRRKDQATAGLTYTVQFSADLGTWESSIVTPTVVADDGTYQVVTVRYPFFVNGQKARFFRVSITPN